MFFNCQLCGKEVLKEDALCHKFEEPGVMYIKPNHKTIVI